MGRARQARSDATRERLMAVARELFAHSAFHEVSVRQIAVAAGRAPSSVFRYWPDKADLWRAVMGSEPAPPPMERPAELAAEAHLGAEMRDPLDIALGAAIRTRRTAGGLSQSDLAKVLSTSFQQVSRYERGHCAIPAAALVRLSAAYGWKWTELEGMASALKTPPPT